MSNKHARAMLAHSRLEPRAAEAGPRAPDEGPSLEDLTLPEPALRDAGVRQLVSFVMRVHSFRVAAFGRFDDAFEHLVTVGDADGYPACVERFKPKFAALDANLERIAMRLDALHQAVLGGLVRGVVRCERTRFTVKLDEQVLRQRLSVSELESEERPALKASVKAKEQALAAQASAVEEALVRRTAQPNRDVPSGLWKAR